jgi:Tfp pilus assembly protein PilW
MANRPPRHVASFLREERGMLSLMELLVAIPIMLAVLAASLGLYDLAVRSGSRDASRVRALIDQSGGMERMSRELRSAIAVRYKTSEIIDAQLASTKRWVRYDCSAGSCKRYEGPSEGVFDKGPDSIIPGVESAEFALFADVPGAGLQPNYIDPTYVTVTVRVNAKGSSNPIVLNDGFNLRNFSELG